MLHVVHAATFTFAFQVPAGQGLQVGALMIDPAFSTNCPAMHGTNATHTVDGSPSSSHVPAAQYTSAVVPPAQYPEMEHATHVPCELSCVPAGQPPVGTGTDWFGPDVVVPLGTTAHTRSWTEDGRLMTYVPLAQVDHTAQLVTFSVTLNVPSAHELQI